MVVRTDVSRGWHLGSSVVGRGSDSERLIAQRPDVLTPGGRAAVYHRIVTLPPDETHPRPHTESRGICRADVATGKNERAGFEARPTENPSCDLAFGGSPDTKSVFIAQTGVCQVGPNRTSGASMGLEPPRRESSGAAVRGHASESQSRSRPSTGRPHASS